MPPAQTEAQRQASFSAAGLTSAQQTAVKAGTPDPASTAPTYSAINGPGTGSIIPPAQTKTEPAVISASSVDQEIGQNKDKLAAIAQKGTTTGADGSMKYADGSVAGAPEGSTFNETTGKYEYNGKTYSAAEFYDPNNQDADYTAIQKMFEPLKASSDAATLATINGIHSQFDALRADQTEFNRTAEQSRSQALMLGGSSRYAPLTASGTMLAQTSYGLRQIQNLNDKENAAIAQAQAAQATQDYKLMSDSLGMAESVRKEKQTKAQEVLKQISDANQKLQDQRLEVNQGNAVAEQMTNGVTDPAQILKTINESGMNMSATDVQKQMKALADATGANGIKGLTGDVGNFYTLKGIAGALPASILALPAEQQLAAYIKMVNNAKLAPPKPNVTNNYNGTGAPGTLSKEGQAWVTAVQNGNSTMASVPAALKNEVAIGLANTDTTSYSPLAASRFTTAANKMTSKYIDLPQYQLTANGLPYLQRIDAAMQTPGSISDQDLLDSLTKLNTAGNAISDAQVKLITDGASTWDNVNKMFQHVQNGGVLSTSQRDQIQKIAKAIFANYQKGYQPVYDKAVKELEAAGIPEPFWGIPDLNNLSAQGNGGYQGIPGHPDIGSSGTLDSFLSSSGDLSSQLGGEVDWAGSQ